MRSEVLHHPHAGVAELGDGADEPLLVPVRSRLLCDALHINHSIIETLFKALLDTLYAKGSYNQVLCIQRSSYVVFYMQSVLII